MVTGDRVDLFADDRILRIALRLPSFEEALARLLYVIENRRPCGLVVGLAGTGKTVLLDAAAYELSGAQWRLSYRPLTVSLRAAGGAGLAWNLAARMGLTPDPSATGDELWRVIADRFEGQALSGLSLVPIIDHLDQSNRAAVLELERCCQLAGQFRSTVVASARLPLGAPLAEVARPLCDLRIELPLWTAQETATFLTQIVEPASSIHWEPDAVEAAHACAAGRMRDTLQIARLAIFAVQAQGHTKIDADLVEAIANELWQPPASTRDSRSGLSSTTLAATR